MVLPLRVRYLFALDCERWAADPRRIDPRRIDPLVDAVEYRPVCWADLPVFVLERALDKRYPATRQQRGGA